MVNTGPENAFGLATAGKTNLFKVEYRVLICLERNTCKEIYGKNTPSLFVKNIVPYEREVILTTCQWGAISPRWQHWSRIKS